MCERGERGRKTPVSVRRPLRLRASLSPLPTRALRTLIKVLGRIPREPKFPPDCTFIVRRGGGRTRPGPKARVAHDGSGPCRYGIAGDGGRWSTPPSILGRMATMRLVYQCRGRRNENELRDDTFEECRAGPPFVAAGVDLPECRGCQRIGRRPRRERWRFRASTRERTVVPRRLPLWKWTLRTVRSVGRISRAARR